MSQLNDLHFITQNPEESCLTRFEKKNSELSKMKNLEYHLTIRI